MKKSRARRNVHGNKIAQAAAAVVVVHTMFLWEQLVRPGYGNATVDWAPLWLRCGADAIAAAIAAGAALPVLAAVPAWTAAVLRFTGVAALALENLPVAPGPEGLVVKLWLLRGATLLALAAAAVAQRIAMGGSTRSKRAPAVAAAVVAAGAAPWLRRCLPNLAAPADAFRAVGALSAAFSLLLVGSSRRHKASRWRTALFVAITLAPLALPNPPLDSIDNPQTIWQRASLENGLVGIVEQHGPQPVRFLRGDYSLLGGVYPTFGNQSIFGVFYLGDALQFVPRPNVPFDTARGGYADGARLALHLGVGAGVGPKHMLESGCRVHAVDIDARVVDAAETFFSFPRLPRSSLPSGLTGESRMFVADALEFAAAAERQGIKYDFIVHDLFSGGSIAGPLVAQPFIKQLAHALLRPNGVLVLNLVGKRRHVVTRHVWDVLRGHFAHVRAFHDPPPAAATPQREPLHNIVFFCAAFPVRFAVPPTRLRPLDGRHPEHLFVEVLASFQQWELGDEDRVAAPVVSGGELARASAQLAREHAVLMREVLPARTWLRSLAYDGP